MMRQVPYGPVRQPDRNPAVCPYGWGKIFSPKWVQMDQLDYFTQQTGQFTNRSDQSAAHVDRLVSPKK